MAAKGKKIGPPSSRGRKRERLRANEPKPGAFAAAAAAPTEAASPWRLRGEPPTFPFIDYSPNHRCNDRVPRRSNSAEQGRDCSIRKSARTFMESQGSSVKAPLSRGVLAGKFEPKIAEHTSLQEEQEAQASDSPPSVAVMYVQGGGAQGKNGFQTGHPPYLLIADRLAQFGILPPIAPVVSPHFSPAMIADNRSGLQGG